MYFVWFFLGIIAALPLLVIADRKGNRPLSHLFGISLVIAAIIYIGFALVWGDSVWLMIEFTGVAAYGLFYWLAVRFSLLWLAVGWALHPVWDLFVHLLGPGAHVAPQWYAIACLSFDLAVALYITHRWQKMRYKVG